MAGPGHRDASTSTSTSTSTNTKSQIKTQTGPRSNPDEISKRWLRQQHWRTRPGLEAEEWVDDGMEQKKDKKAKN